MILNWEEKTSRQDKIFCIYVHRPTATAPSSKEQMSLIFSEIISDLTYGTGGHKCLGMHLATMGATILFEELFKKITDYELLEDSCQRVFWEHLSGFSKVPIKIMFK